MKNVGHLLDHEHRALCEALRRDMHREEELAITDREWSKWHRDNARADRDLLEVVNPKNRTLRSPTVPVAPSPSFPVAVPASETPAQPAHLEVANA